MNENKKILDARLAAGEISIDEYKQTLALLERHSRLGDEDPASNMNAKAIISYKGAFAMSIPGIQMFNVYFDDVLVLERCSYHKSTSCEVDTSPGDHVVSLQFVHRFWGEKKTRKKFTVNFPDSGNYEVKISYDIMLGKWKDVTAFKI